MLRRLPWLAGLALLGLVVVLALRQGVATGSQPAPVDTPQSIIGSQPLAVATPWHTPAPAVLPTVIPPVAGASTEWRTFAHPHDKYSFRFPPSWYLTTSGGPADVVILTNYDAYPGRKIFADTDKFVKVQIASNVKPAEQSLEEFALSFMKLPEAGTLVSITPTTVAGRPAVKRVVSHTQPVVGTWTNVSIWIEQGPGQVLSVGVFPGESVYIDDFGKLLDSFGLID